MVNGFTKYRWLLLVGLLWIASPAFAEYKVVATPLTHDVKDLSERNSKILDQNGEHCALIKLETPIPTKFTFNLGAQQIEKRVNKDDEIWIWVSADVKKITIRCEECTALKDYRVSLKSGNVYRTKLTTGLPAETSTTQHCNIYCEHTPYMISIDGAEAVKQEDKNFHTELPVGAHDVTVSARYYKTYTTKIRLVRSCAYSDTVRLEKNYGEIAVHANLSGYEVVIDGEKKTYSKTYWVEPGMHYLTISKDRYKVIQDTIKVRLGEKKDYMATFVPNFTVVTISSRDPKTEIWIDNELKGHEKVTMELLYGSHTIQGRREGYDTWEYSVHEFDVRSERTITIPKLNQQFGSLRLIVFPSDATVYLDGIEISLKDGVYNSQLPIGLHNIYMRMTDYRSIRDTMVIVAGKVKSQEYHLEHIPLGVISLSTDKDVAIFLKGEDVPTFYGMQSVKTKLPAGEDIIILKNRKGETCEHRVFVMEGDKNEPVFLPFQRELLVRANVHVDYMSLSSEGKRVPFKMNKRTKLSPLKYVIQGTKIGYESYYDTIDLSTTDVKKMIYRIEMKREGDDTPEEYKHHAPLTFQKYYDNAGRWFVGVLDVGYLYSFADSAHVVTMGLLPFRWKMLGMSLADFEMSVYSHKQSGNKMQLVYNPKISLVIPISKAGAITFYGGANVNIADIYNKEPVRVYARGGMSILANGVGAVPMELFGEYRYPIFNANPPEDKLQLFRVGVNILFGFDK